MSTAAAAPDRSTPMGTARHLALASFWFGLNFHWIPILAVLIPYQVTHLLPESEQGRGIALVTAAGAIFAMLLPPVVGAYSDRLSTRFGRRRPIMVAGTLVNAVGLVILMLAGSYSMLLAGYLVIQVFNNAAGAAFNGIVPDVVPEPEFGKASGMLGAMVQVGAVAGLGTTLVMSSVLHHIEWTYGVMAVVIVASLLPTLWASRGEGLEPPSPKPAMTAAAAMADFLRPLSRGDFAWVVYTRTMVTAGIYCVLPFLLLFFENAIHIRHAEDFTTLWELILLVAATPFGLAGGWVSDRLGRKPFVYAAGALMSLVVLVFVVFYPAGQGVLLLLGALFGTGYGLYYAVDWALACDTLPDRSRPAKDMGLFHVALTLPQVLIPGAMGFLLDLFNSRSAGSGYRVIFVAAMAFYILGTVFVSRIRGVR